ncbi:MAG: hypothetical protein H6774_03080 [Pseudomonadales bacterium]|nr:hypothetical protein [Candidatus Woesebacteria bacterium]MCB9802049.1 hypothetical protein [Pseudomonadales bacterium]
MTKFWTLLALALVFTLLAGGQSYGSYSDVDSMLYRAQVSADAVKMERRIGQLQTNMERRGMTRGYAAIIFRTPTADMSLDYEAVVDLRERALLVSQMPENSTEYQVGLDDLRGTLREIEIEGWYFTLIRSPFAWIALFLWVSWVWVLFME